MEGGLGLPVRCWPTVLWSSTLLPHLLAGQLPCFATAPPALQWKGAVGVHLHCSPWCGVAPHTDMPAAYLLLCRRAGDGRGPGARPPPLRLCRCVRRLAVGSCRADRLWQWCLEGSLPVDSQSSLGLASPAQR